jgi:hypothetical protein
VRASPSRFSPRFPNDQSRKRRSSLHPAFQQVGYHVQQVGCLHGAPYRRVGAVCVSSQVAVYIVNGERGVVQGIYVQCAARVQHCLSASTLARRGGAVFGMM